jgi:hypothetical protein
MSDLDDAMLERMTYIVNHELRPFSYMDFLNLMKHKTFRNKISKLKKEGIVELDFNSGIAFYTLKDHRFGKAGTPNHTGVTISHNDPVYQMIKNLPMDKQSIHNIRLRFTAPNIYETFSDNTTFPKDTRSGDIRLPYWNKNNAIVQVRIHKTDTVSVIIDCSFEPFPLDANGINRFFTTLASTEALLVGILLMVYHEKINQNQSIPDYRKWVITMWHFGRDGLECSKRDYHIAVGKGQQILERIYTKDFGKYKKIRLERQEYPRISVEELIEEKLNQNFQT